MASPSRTAILSKTYKVLKKHYKAAESKVDRTLFEQLLFACLLENSRLETAEQVFRALQEQFFDWNEVRVSTVRELADVMAPLTDSEDSARRLKSVLQSIFESLYSFDLEGLRRVNIGQAIKKLEKFSGVSPYAMAYVVQHGLGGHAIPVNAGCMRGLLVVGAVNAAELAEARVPGLERAIPKSKGIEAASLLHQWGVDLEHNRYSPTQRKLFLEISPDCKERLPKRPPKKARPVAESPPAEAEPSQAECASGKTEAQVGKKAPREKTGPGPDKKKAAAKKSSAKKKTAPSKASSPAKKRSAKQVSIRKPR